jgi:hypothetical protein
MPFLCLTECFAVALKRPVSFIPLSINPLIGGNVNLTQKKGAYSETGNSAMINLCVAGKSKVYNGSDIDSPIGNTCNGGGSRTFERFRTLFAMMLRFRRPEN